MVHCGSGLCVGVVFVIRGGAQRPVGVAVPQLDMDQNWVAAWRHSDLHPVNRSLLQSGDHFPPRCSRVTQVDL